VTAGRDPGAGPSGGDSPAATRRAFSVGVFALHEGRVLLIHHKRLGTWLPPGGEIEPGETPQEAARRELFEETGLSARFERISPIHGTPAGLIGYEEHLAGSKGLHMNFVFAVRVETDAVTPNDEFSDHRWVSSFDGIDCPENVRQLGVLALSLERGAPWL
jgi:8-oxo-dGTP diphosphatase